MSSFVNCYCRRRHRCRAIVEKGIVRSFVNDIRNKSFPFSVNFVASPSISFHSRVNDLHPKSKHVENIDQPHAQTHTHVQLLLCLQHQHAIHIDASLLLLNQQHHLNSLLNKEEISPLQSTFL